MTGRPSYQVPRRLIAQRVARRFLTAQWLVQAFGVTDLAKFSQEGRSFGVLSAYQARIKKKKSQGKHGDLVGELIQAGYRPHWLKASWKDVETQTIKHEKSLIIPKIDFQTLYRLGKKYSQDAFIFKDPSGTIGIYGYSPEVATMAYDSKGEMAVDVSTDPHKEYSRGRALSFGLRLVEGKPFPYHGKPVTRQDIVEALA